MKKLILNLGSFDKCSEYLLHTQKAEYPVDFYRNVSKSNCTKVLFYMQHQGNVISIDLPKSQIVVPTFDIASYVNFGKVDDEKTVQQFLCKIELEIFSMIQRILTENKIECNTENIVIPISKIEIFDDDKSHGCYGWADVGIAVFA